MLKEPAWVVKGAWLILTKTRLLLFWVCLVKLDTPTVMSSRREVLSLYRRIFSLARVWRATIETDTSLERQYIREEARKLFRKNKNVNKIRESCRAFMCVFPVAGSIRDK